MGTSSTRYPYLSHQRNPRWNSETFQNAPGRRGFSIVRGGRPRLQKNLIYPCRFVFIRGCPLAERFGSHSERCCGCGGVAPV